MSRASGIPLRRPPVRATHGGAPHDGRWRVEHELRTWPLVTGFPARPVRRRGWPLDAVREQPTWRGRFAAVDLQADADR